jgi:hypothetical protein
MSSLRAARRRPLQLLATAAMLVLALYLVSVAMSGDGASYGHYAGRRGGGADAEIDSAWAAALSAGAEVIAHAAAPRRAASAR